MLSNPTRAAVCVTGFMLSGCMQSMPTAETITKPTSEAFARLAAWTPWRPTPEPAVQQVANPTPVESAPLPSPVARQAEFDSAVSRSSMPKPRISGAQLAPARNKPAIRPAIPASYVPATTAPAGSSLLPAAVSCQTSSQPGERVRMECKPVE